MWAAATPAARLVVAGLLGGLSLAELAAMRFEHIDFDACYLRVPGVSGRAGTLREPLRRLLNERRTGSNADAPLSDARGNPLSAADLDGLIACAARDAGLASPGEVTADTLRHTYVAYLVRQGARLSEIAEFVGSLSPAVFRDYARLSPAGPGLPMEDINPVFPGLR